MRRVCTAAVALLLIGHATLPRSMAYSIQQEEDQASIDALGSDPIQMQTVSSKQVPSEPHHSVRCMLKFCLTCMTTDLHSALQP